MRIAQQLACGLLLLVLAALNLHQGGMDYTYLLLLTVLACAGGAGREQYSRLSWVQLALLAALALALYANVSERTLMYPFAAVFAVLLYRPLMSAGGLLFGVAASLPVLALLAHYFPNGQGFFQWHFFGSLLNAGLLAFLLAFLGASDRGEDSKKLALALVYVLLALVVQSRLLLLASGGMALTALDMRNHAKQRALQGLALLVFAACVAWLLYLKQASVFGRFALYGFFMEHLPVKILGYTPFAHWYTSTVIVEEAVAASTAIGEVYSVAFNDYIQLFVEFGLLPFAGFALYNLLLLAYYSRRGDMPRLVAVLGMNLMLLTSYALQYASSFFFFCLLNLHLARPVASTWRPAFGKAKIWLGHPKWGSRLSLSLLVLALAVFYLPRAHFALHAQADSHRAEWLKHPLNRYLLKNRDYRYTLAKQTQWAHPQVAEVFLGLLERDYLSYEMLIASAETKELLGAYRAALGYYQQAELVRPFALFPKYKQCLIYEALGEPERLAEALQSVRDLALRVHNRQTRLMLSELEERFGQ